MHIQVPEDGRCMLWSEYLTTHVTISLSKLENPISQLLTQEEMILQKWYYLFRGRWRFGKGYFKC